MRYEGTGSGVREGASPLDGLSLARPGAVCRAHRAPEIASVSYFSREFDSEPQSPRGSRANAIPAVAFVVFHVPFFLRFSFSGSGHTPSMTIFIIPSKAHTRASHIKLNDAATTAVQGRLKRKRSSMHLNLAPEAKRISHSTIWE